MENIRENRLFSRFIKRVNIRFLDSNRKTDNEDPENGSRHELIETKVF